MEQLAKEKSEVEAFGKATEAKFKILKKKYMRIKEQFQASEEEQAKLKLEVQKNAETQANQGSQLIQLEDNKEELEQLTLRLEESEMLVAELRT